MNASEFISFFLGCWIVIVIAYLVFENFDVPFLGMYRGGSVDSCGHINKRQWVRLLDIFILGPFGLYLGYLIYNGRNDEITKPVAFLIMVYGLLTIIYNGANYIKNSKV